MMLGIAVRRTDLDARSRRHAVIDQLQVRLIADRVQRDGGAGVVLSLPLRGSMARRPDRMFSCRSIGVAPE